MPQTLRDQCKKRLVLFVIVENELLNLTKKKFKINQSIHNVIILNRV